MFCYGCNDLIKKEITYLNIFKTYQHKICDNCFNSNTFIQKLIVFPTNEGIVENHILFEKPINPLAIMSFLKPYYLYFLKKKRNFIILCFDSNNKMLYNMLQQITLGDIFLITLFNKKTKENDFNV